MNVMVEWKTLLLRIREVRNSNLGPEIACPEVLRGFPESLQISAGIMF
jgi:hypothetical protein